MASRFRALTYGQRIAAGGATLSTAVALLILLVSMNSAGRLSAMERMLQSVREASSYSFRVTNKTTFPPKDNEPARIRMQKDVVYWQAPAASEMQWFGDMHAESKAWRVNEQTGAPDGEPAFHLKEIHPTGKRGIIVLYEHRLGSKYYFRTPPVAADEALNVSPIAKLRAVRDQSGTVLRELGVRELGGKLARGYVATFKDAAAFKGCGEVEVWVDAETDLPLEFSFETNVEGIRDEYRISECQWNIELDPDLFVPTAPEGFTDASPPREPEVIAQITSALALYASLSGGKYPKAAEFDAARIRDEMLKLAGFSGAPQDAWKDDLKYVEIQNAEAGLERLARVLRNNVNSGYYGGSVGPHDKDKVLLWWIAWPEDVKVSFRVFFGDLRTEILPLADWAKLVPAEAAASFLPIDAEEAKH